MFLATHVPTERALSPVMTASTTRPSRLRRFALRAALLLGGAASTGCAASLPEGKSALDGVDLLGTRALDAADVETALSLGTTPSAQGLRPYWMDAEEYDRGRIEQDLARVEAYYRARGFHEARVRAARVIKTGARSVRVQIVIDEGPRISVSAIEIAGLDALPAKVRARVLDLRHLTAGEPFDEDVHQAFAPAAERVLAEEGFAHAKAWLRADVDLAHHRAAVRVEILAGPPCTFGEVSIDGLRELSVDAVRAIVGIQPGEPYSTRRLASARAALAGLATFDSIEIEPRLDDATSTRIPVRIALREAKLRGLVVEPEIGFEPARNQLSLRARWEDRDFLGGLRDLRLEATPSLLLVPGLFSSTHARAGMAAEVALRQPRLIEARTLGFASLGGAIVPDPLGAFRTSTLGGAVGIERRLGPYASASLSYRRSIARPVAYDDGALPPNALPTDRATAQLGALELAGSIDTRDDRRRPRRGLLGTLSLQYAAASRVFLAGDYGDLRVQPEIRLFGPLAKRVVLAIRFMVGFVIPRSYDARFPTRRTPDANDPSSYDLSTAGDTPYARAFFSGGANGNRGYATREIGLRDCATLAGGGRELGAGCSVVVGGASVWEGSVELRFDLGGNLTTLLFVDASDVSREVFDLRLGYPHLSVGPGLRYDTPLGPLRFDFGIRVPGAQRVGGALDPREAPRDLQLGIRGPFAVHLSLGDAF
jgi:outer membrane protein insertion porin family/translocation and assembly module TamA